MAIKFFGHYLLDEGKLTSEQLVEAIDYQSKKNLSLGELTVRETMITEKEATKINDIQRSLDQRFGEVAISLGLLKDEQIEELLTLQKKEHIFFGEVLILKQFMTQDDLDTQLHHFEEQQRIETVKLDDKIEAIDKAGLFKEAIGVLQKLYPRIVHDYIKLVKVDTINTSELNGIIALQKMRGDIHLNFALEPEDAVSLAISSQFLKMEVDTIDEMVVDVIGEFVNVVLGNIAVKLSSNNTKVELTPPEIVSADTFRDSDYYTFNFTTTQGNLNLYLKL